MSAVKYNPTDEDRAQLEEWLAERPEVIQCMARAWPPWHCYKMRGSAGHYSIYSYAENETVTLTHGDDSTLPGVQVFGIKPTSLVLCDCGKWEFPSAEHIERTRERIRQQVDRYPGIRPRRRMN